MILKPDFFPPILNFFSFKFFQVSRVIAGPDGFFLTGSRQPTHVSFHCRQFCMGLHERGRTGRMIIPINVK